MEQGDPGKIQESRSLEYRAGATGTAEPRELLQRKVALIFSIPFVALPFLNLRRNSPSMVGYYWTKIFPIGSQWWQLLTDREMPLVIAMLCLISVVLLAISARKWFTGVGNV